MSRISTIELFKEDMKFSAGHFTIFSSTIRENLHGHNYNLYVAVTTEIGDEGLSFDYRFYKDKLMTLCESLDETVLMPGKNKYLEIIEQENHYQITFNAEAMQLLKRDVTILPITNVTLEELSNWFLQQLLSDKAELAKNKVSEINIKVYSAFGQSGSASWKRM